MSKALVLGPGGLRGAYSGGVVATLGRELGCDYFDTLYLCSAGAYTGSYLASGQPDMIERIWRECVHGDMLVRAKNMFSGDRHILDLHYLNDVLRSDRYKLSVADVLQSRAKLFMVATQYRTGHARYFTPTTEEDYFLQVRASAAVPVLHQKVYIDGEHYIDGGLSDPLPIARALADGHDEVVVVINRPELPLSPIEQLAWGLCTSVFPGKREMRQAKTRRQVLHTLVEKHSDRVKVIKPSEAPSLRWTFDSSEQAINQLVDLGIRDALTFLRM